MTGATSTAFTPSTTFAVSATFATSTASTAAAAAKSSAALSTAGSSAGTASLRVSSSFTNALLLSTSFCRPLSSLARLPGSEARVVVAAGGVGANDGGGSTGTWKIGRLAVSSTGALSIEAQSVSSGSAGGALGFGLAWTGTFARDLVSGGAATSTAGVATTTAAGREAISTAGGGGTSATTAGAIWRRGARAARFVRSDRRVPEMQPSLTTERLSRRCVRRPAWARPRPSEWVASPGLCPHAWNHRLREHRGRRDSLRNSRCLNDRRMGGGLCSRRRRGRWRDGRTAAGGLAAGGGTGAFAVAGGFAFGAGGATFFATGAAFAAAAFGFGVAAGPDRCGNKESRSQPLPVISLASSCAAAAGSGAARRPCARRSWLRSWSLSGRPAWLVSSPSRRDWRCRSRAGRRPRRRNHCARIAIAKGRQQGVGFEFGADRAEPQAKPLAAVFGAGDLVGVQAFDIELVFRG